MAKGTSRSPATRNSPVAPPADPPAPVGQAVPEVVQSEPQSGEVIPPTSAPSIDSVEFLRGEVERLTAELQVAHETIAQLRLTPTAASGVEAAPADELRGVLIEFPLADESSIVPIRQIDLSRRAAGVFTRVASGLIEDGATLSSGKPVSDIRTVVEWIADQLLEEHAPAETVVGV